MAPSALPEFLATMGLSDSLPGPLTVIWLHPYLADCPLPSRNEAETGSLALRLAGSLFEASPNGLPRFALDWLHVEWVIYMVSSFHLTRSARLILAHRA